jgi:hypothetical protein
VTDELNLTGGSVEACSRDCSTDPRPTYGYDALNRATSVSYSLSDSLSELLEKALNALEKSGVIGGGRSWIGNRKGESAVNLTIYPSLRTPRRGKVRQAAATEFLERAATLAVASRSPLA